MGDCARISATSVRRGNCLRNHRPSARNARAGCRIGLANPRLCEYEERIIAGSESHVEDQMNWTSLGIVRPAFTPLVSRP